MFKFITIVAFIAVTSAHRIPVGYHFTALHPVSWIKHESKAEWKEEKPAEPIKIEEPEKPANYDFKYEVHDEKTGDIKRQSETATNGAIKGQYSLIDSDGFKRIVDYTADDVHGFQATVKREPTHFKIPEPIKAEPVKSEPEAKIIKYIPVWSHAPVYGWH